jgi:hypothetical protein
MGERHTRDFYEQTLVFLAHHPEDALQAGKAVDCH